LAPHRWAVAVLFLVLSTACGTGRMARASTQEGGPLIHLPRAGATSPVELSPQDFTRALRKEARQMPSWGNPEKAAREQFAGESRSGWYQYTPRQGVVPLDGQPLATRGSQADVRVTQEYLRFCAAIGKPGDCRQLLGHSPVLTGDGRYALGMSFAVEEIIPEMMQSFQDMADPEALKASLYWAMTIYAAMWLMPEPVFSKGLATAITASLICYIGVDTFWTLIQGWRRLVQAVDLATSLPEIREAGRTYGKVMGRNAARAFALLFTAAIGQTAASFSAKVPTLPGSAQASVARAARRGLPLTALSHVEAVAVTADAVTIALAPNASAAVAQSGGGAASTPVDAEGPEHHIASDKFSTSTQNGGPWTPRYQELFDKAGMSLDDAANKVRVPGHKGPHPQEYHEEIFRRLRDATLECRSIQQCQEILTHELHRLGRMISTPGTRLNKLVTRSP
jgi:hypothetical protein